VFFYFGILFCNCAFSSLAFANGHANLTCGINSGMTCREGSLFRSYVLAYYPNEIDIIGTKGGIRIKKPFWCPTNIVVNIEAKVCGTSYVCILAHV
jgi:hypothetical protein